MITQLEGKSGTVSTVRQAEEQVRAGNCEARLLLSDSEAICRFVNKTHYSSSEALMEGTTKMTMGSGLGAARPSRAITKTWTTVHGATQMLSSVRRARLSILMSTSRARMRNLVS
jgi:hypothetical protein